MRLMLLLVALAISACAPRIVEAGPTITSPRVAGPDALVMRDGLSLGLTIWPADQPKAILLALHGMNDYANAFAMPGPWFAEQGITTYAYDQRGFGRSPEIGMWAGQATLTADLRDAIMALRARHPGLPIAVLGESMGGAVVMAARGESQGLNADRVILVAPAVWGWSTQNIAARWGLWLIAHLQPWGPMEQPRGIRLEPSDNREVMRGLAEDPLFLKTTRADALYGLVDLMESANASAEKQTTPLLMLYGARDDIIPQEPTRDVMARLPKGTRIVVYERGHHMLLRDSQRARVWSDIASFILAPDAPLPSGEEQQSP